MLCKVFSFTGRNFDLIAFYFLSAWHDHQLSSPFLLAVLVAPYLRLQCTGNLSDACPDPTRVRSRSCLTLPYVFSRTCWQPRLSRAHLFSRRGPGAQYPWGLSEAWASCRPIELKGIRSLFLVTRCCDTKMQMTNSCWCQLEVTCPKFGKVSRIVPKKGLNFAEKFHNRYFGVKSCELVTRSACTFMEWLMITLWLSYFSKVERSSRSPRSHATGRTFSYIELFLNS